MTLTSPESEAIWEDSGAIFMARLVGADASDVQQSDISSGTFAVFDLTTGSPNAVATGSITVGDNIFDTLQTDARWTFDSTGYNFRDTLGASVFASPHLFRVEYRFVPAAGEVFWAVYEIRAQEIKTT